MREVPVEGRKSSPTYSFIEEHKKNYGVVLALEKIAFGFDVGIWFDYHFTIEDTDRHFLKGLGES